MADSSQESTFSEGAGCFLVLAGIALVVFALGCALNFSEALRIVFPVHKTSQE